MPDPKIRKRVKNPEGEDVVLTENVYQHLKWSHPEVITWVDTLLETITHPDKIRKYDGDDVVYFKKLPNHIKSFVQEKVEYCVIPVTRRSEGYLGMKTCFLVTEETLRKKWRF